VKPRSSGAPARLRPAGCRVRRCHVVGFDGVILPPRQPRLVARLGEGEFRLSVEPHATALAELAEYQGDGLGEVARDSGMISATIPI
jgi:hypothetical protein